MKKNIVLVLVLFCLLSFVLTLSQAQTSRAFSTRSAFHSETGALRFVGASAASPIVVPAAVSPGLSTTDSAAAILDVYGPQFGVNNPRQDLRVTQTLNVDGKRMMNRYQQYYNGVPVIGGQMVVSTTATGGLLSITGEASPNLALNTTPAIDSLRAQQTAVAWAAREFGYNVSELVASTPELSVYDARLMGPLKHPVQLVWNVEVNSTTMKPLRAMVLVNAHQGGIALGFNKLDDKNAIPNTRMAATSGAAIPLPSAGGEEAALVETVTTGVEPRVPGVANMETYDTNGTATLPGTFLCDENKQPCTNGAIPDADDAHRFGKDSYDYFWKNFGRDSLDGNGLLLKSSVRYSKTGGQFCNAFWNGTQMIYGKDCDIAADDVVGHELTHGLTDKTSQLFYFYQSGAINESMSDVFGEFIDLTNVGGNDSPNVRWVVGEDTPFEAPDGTPGLRFMNNPPKDGDSPDRIQSPYYWMEEYGSVNGWDNGGVHINSGVNNKAAYLMTDGGNFNGINTIGLGIPKVAAIYYDASVNKMVSGTDYNDLYEILYQSCLDLVGGPQGITTADCDQVTNATQAVEMHKLPQYNWSTPEAEVCPAGQSPAVVFGDNFENGDSQFTRGTLMGPNVWMTMEEMQQLVGDVYTHSGVRGWLANNVGGETENNPLANDSFLATVNGINIPAGAYLRFAHAFLLEYDSSGLYDGGIVEYSTNGTTWTQLNSVDSGEGYTGTLATGGGNPLEGKQAFAGDSHGFVSTRFNLSALAGQNVKFRWRMGADKYFGLYGWFVDDIYVYTCGAGQTPTETPRPGQTVTPEPDGDTTELVGNGGFENRTVDLKPVTAPWVVKKSTGDKVLCNKVGKAPVSANGDCAFRFKGNVGEASTLQQMLSINGVAMEAGDSIDWFFRLNVPGTAVGRFKVIISYTDGTPTTKIPFAPVRTNGYEVKNVVSALASGNVEKIKLSYTNRSTSGKWFLDDVSVWHYPPSGAGLVALPGSEGAVSTRR